MKGLMEKTLKNKGKATILLVRHGATDQNNKNVSRGWTNHPLDEEGIKEAKKVAQKLKKEHIDLIITSDLKRARQTAGYISEATKVPVYAAVKDLRTWNIGKYTEKPSGEFPNEYYTDPECKIPEGESLNQFKNRVLKEIQLIEKSFPGKKVVVVAHNRVERAYDAWMAKGCPKDLSIDIKVFRHTGISPGSFKQK